MKWRNYIPKDDFVALVEAKPYTVEPLRPTLLDVLLSRPRYKILCDGIPLCIVHGNDIGVTQLLGLMNGSYAHGVATMLTRLEINLNAGPLKAEVPPTT
jgi:hypothetical protein